MRSAFLLILLTHGYCEAKQTSFFWKAGEHYVNTYQSFKNSCWKSVLKEFPKLCEKKIADIPGVSTQATFY